MIVKEGKLWDFVCGHNGCMYMRLGLSKKNAEFEATSHMKVHSCEYQD